MIRDPCLSIHYFVYSDHPELAGHELSDSIDICLGEVGKIIEESSGSLPLLGNAVEPYIGIELKSRDDAKEF
ncbi:hypothetical protein Gotur_030356 [Gossypium turneri]